MEANNAEYMQLSHAIETWVPKYNLGHGLRELLLWDIRSFVPKLSRPDAQIQVQLQKALEELKELAISRGSLVLDSVVQRRDRLDPRFVLGRGHGVGECELGGREQKAQGQGQEGHGQKGAKIR